MRRRLDIEIEAFMSDRLGRPCLLLASGRLALYVALRGWLKPGHRVLMSPVTDDVVMFVALAAGLRPVMAPVSSTDGNIDPFAIPDETWAGLGGVLTTNLYGLPDRVIELRRQCDRHGIPLIEDAAHALETTVGGRLVGTFGDAATFSLSKHVGAACGGLVAFTDDRARAELERLRDEASDPHGRGGRVLRDARHGAVAVAEWVHLVWPLRWLRRKLGIVERRGENRMPLRPVELERAIAAGPGLGAFHPWVRVDRRSYQVPPSAAELGVILRRLHSLEADAARRIEGVARLRTLRAAAPAVAQGDPLPLFRVPLLLDDRGALIARLERHLRSIGYIYDPPLDEYAAPEFVDTCADAEAACAWTSRVFPVDPLEADLFLRCLRAERDRPGRAGRVGFRNGSLA